MSTNHPNAYWVEMEGIRMLTHKVKSPAASPGLPCPPPTLPLPSPKMGGKHIHQLIRMTGWKDPLSMKCKPWLIRMRRAKWKIKLTSVNSQAECCKSRADNPGSLNTPHH